jgi:hypothetical protein
MYIRVLGKVRQRRHRNPLFGHIRGRDFFLKTGKKEKKSTHWSSRRHETQFTTKIWPVLSFPERFQPIIAAAIV